MQHASARRDLDTGSIAAANDSGTGFDISDELTQRHRDRRGQRVTRYSFLDSLRGLAICGVVLTHVGLSTPGLPDAVNAFSVFGLRGVQLFFIVSALTLCLTRKGERFDYSNFYIRRFFRIAPMFYVSGLFYLLFYRFIGNEFAPQGIQAFDVLATMLFIHGLVPRAINNVVPGGWSIASEAIFYALFPLLLAWTSTIRRAGLLVGASFALAFLDLLLLHVISKGAAPDSAMVQFAHFNIIVNMPAFACGFLLYHLIKAAPESKIKPPMSSAICLFALLALVAVCACSNRLPMAQLLTVPLLAIVVYCAARWSPTILVNPVLSYLGEISFSLYLVHFFVLYVANSVVPLPEAPMARLVVLYLLVLAGSSVVATLTYRVIEVPMIAVGRAMTGRARGRTMRPVPTLDLPPG